MSNRNQAKLFASYNAGLTASATTPEPIAPGAHGMPFEAYEPRFHARDCDEQQTGVRCGCGALLARWVATGLELKCRRCKQTTLIPFPRAARKPNSST